MHELSLAASFTELFPLPSPESYVVSFAFFDILLELNYHPPESVITIIRIQGRSLLTSKEIAVWASFFSH